MVSWSWLMCFALMPTISISQRTDEWNVVNSCDPKVTCSECIQMNNCSWCMEPVMDNKPRCFHSSLDYCKKEYEWNPKNEQQILTMHELTQVGSAGNTANEEIVQITPQNISLKLRINEEHRINWQYKEVEGYPLDVYFLMDLSKSMENDKEKLLKLGDLLAHSIPNITSDFRLGFGSFVDKSVKQNRVAGWSKSNLYEFKNHMSLSTNATQFIEQLRGIAVSDNPVAHGGGLEGIMQAIVCRYEIKWRENARRILVFSTNSGFRYAEDNNVDGVVPPNDGQCHLDVSQMNSQPILQDYPSVTQINSKIRQNQINVIFAVTRSQSAVYENLSYQVEGSSSAILAEDSSNVIELIRNDYNRISSSVEMRDTSPSVVQITYSSSTFWEFAPIQSNRRYGIKAGDVVKFSAGVVVTSCPNDERNWRQIFEIYPVGLNQRLIVNLEILCSCPCENNSVICGSAV